MLYTQWVSVSKLSVRMILRTNHDPPQIS